MPPSPSPRRHERGEGIALAALTWAAALLGALCLLLTAWALLIGARPLVIRTGSMAPTLRIGTVVVVRPEAATSATVGDIVAVVRSDGRRIMHRVQRVRPAGGGSATLVLRGDRNRAADPPVTVAAVERPLLTIPVVGRPLTWLGGRWVQYWLGVATGLLALAWAALRRRRGAAGSGGRRTPRRDPLRA
jgi:signal peptidase I